MARLTGADPETAFSARLPFGPGAARTARARVRELLHAHDVGERTVEDAELVVHELVVNGVTHGLPSPGSQLEVGCEVFRDAVVITVRDRGTRGVVEAQSLTADGTSGRGLAIVAALCDSWSVDRSDGTCVTARLAR